MITDKHNILYGVQNWNNHLPLMLIAMEATQGIVVEMGMGDGSTPQLHKYCGAEGRMLMSYDNNREWCEKFRPLDSTWHNIGFVEKWEDVQAIIPFSVVLVDHAPGEQRHRDIQRLMEKVEVFVLHDTEDAADGYQYKKIWHLFKYRIDIKTEGACATALSNTIDLTVHKGLELGGYLIS